MEDTSMDVVEEKAGDNNGNGAADTASQDDDDDIEPPVTVWLWIENHIVLHVYYIVLFNCFRVTNAFYLLSAFNRVQYMCNFEDVWL